MNRYIAIFLCSLLTLSCGGEKEKVEQKQPIEAPASNILKLNENQLKNISVEVTTLSETNLPMTIQLNAKAEIAPQNTVSITNPFGGYVKRIGLIPGNSVAKGQAVVVLEDPQYIQMQEDYLTTKALLEQASADYNRQRDLNAAQAASDKVMQQAKANKQTLMVKKSALEQRLRLMNINPANVSLGNIQRLISIFSPISGVVSEVNVNVGQFVSPSDVMIKIINPNNALLNIRMFEKDLPQIEVGQQVKAFTNGDPHKKANAIITSISNQVNEDGTINVYSKIVETNGIKLAANMYFNIELEVKNSKANVLPEEAVVSFEGKDYIFEQISSKEFKLLPIKKGSSTEGNIEILTPISKTQNYVNKGAYNLLTALKNSSEE